MNETGTQGPEYNIASGSIPGSYTGDATVPRTNPDFEQDNLMGGDERRGMKSTMRDSDDYHQQKMDSEGLGREMSHPKGTLREPKETEQTVAPEETTEKPGMMSRAKEKVSNVLGVGA